MTGSDAEGEYRLRTNKRWSRRGSVAEYGRSLHFGLTPVVIVAIVALARLHGKGGSPELVISVGALFAVTIAFAYYALSRFPSFHLMPGVWAILALVEFVVSPAYDILTDQLGVGSVSSAESLSAAFGVCGLFVAGLWGGLATARARVRRLARREAEGQDVRQIATGNAAPVIVAFALVSLATELYILRVSGALSGDILGARFEGLIGTSVLTPLIRLVNIGSLVSSWLSVVEVRRRQRRLYFTLGLVSVVVAMVMPYVLHQRFGLIQALGYFALPQLAARRGLTKRGQKLLYAGLGLALIGAWLGNEVSSKLRGSVLLNRSFRLSDAVARDEGLGATHFRHLRLLSVLMDQGIDEPGFGGLYAGRPFVGDMLIILPRKVFPGKPVTTMEVINGVVRGETFTALDRGKYSVHTSSLWVQLYVLGGWLGVFPLAFTFGLAAMLLMGWIARRRAAAEYVVADGILWFTLGWLAFNVVLVPMEIPGLLLAVVCLRAFPVSRPSLKEHAGARHGGLGSEVRRFTVAASGAAR